MKKIKKPKPQKPSSKQPFKLFWWYLKEDEGPVGWILNIIIAFIVIKYLLIPGIGWLLGTSYPLVAVVSGSMEHNGNVDTWWEQQCTGSNGQRVLQKELYNPYGITKKSFENDFRFTNGLNTGDLMVLKGARDVMIGDVIVFNANTKFDPIIHRVVAIEQQEEQKFYKTKGDNNCGSSAFERQIPEYRVVGKSWVRIPLLGYVKLYFEKTLKFIGLESAIILFR